MLRVHDLLQTLVILRNWSSMQQHASHNELYTGNSSNMPHTTSCTQATAATCLTQRAVHGQQRKHALRNWLYTGNNSNMPHATGCTRVTDMAHVAVWRRSSCTIYGARRGLEKVLVYHIWCTSRLGKGPRIPYMAHVTAWRRSSCTIYGARRGFEKVLVYHIWRTSRLGEGPRVPYMAHAPVSVLIKFRLQQS